MMTASLQLVLAAFAASGIVGLGDQYMALFLVGLATRLGLVAMPEALGFIGQDWFLIVVAFAWLLTVPPSAVPAAVAPFFNWIVNALSGPVTLASGALIALANAGHLTIIRPEFATSMYLLSHDAGWTNLAAYQSTDWALLMGGAAVAGGLTFVTWAAKPGIALHTGTTGTYSAPMFAASENGVALLLIPLLFWLERISPYLAIALFFVLVVTALAMLAFAMKKLADARKGVGAILALMENDPPAGLAVLSEMLVWGSGWIFLGQRPRGFVMLALWGGTIALALTGLGLLVALPAYLIIAPRTATALYRFASRTRVNPVA